MGEKKAAALQWTRDLIAPRVIASGQRLRADELVELAASLGIAIVKEPVLAEVLCGTEIGSYIPENTYGAIAGIFAFLEDIGGKPSMVSPV